MILPLALAFLAVWFGSLRRTGLSVTLAALILIPLWSPRLQADSFDTVRLTWQTNLIDNGSSPASVASTANGYWNSMNTSAGREYLWSDLPLGSDSGDVTSTYERLEAMALAWATPGSSLQNNSSLAAVVAGGLDWMNTNVYTIQATEYGNWWDWEIGAPQAFNNTSVLLYPALTGTEITNYCNAIDHFGPDGPAATYGWMTGANTSDKVLVVVLRGVLGRNGAEILAGQTNLDTIFPYVTSGDGFYTDGSFLQHSVFAYTGTYGNVLLSDVASLINLLNNSPWQVTDPNLTNVYNWVFNAFEPLVYNGAMMDMVRGRAISRNYETEFSDGGSTISSARQIAKFAPAATAAAITKWAGSPALPPGQFQFADMDRVVALRSGFGVGISMSSSRIANYESINGENLHGWFTGDGMTYLYLGNSDTQFTGDFWPTVDPYHLPGTTVETNMHANAAGEAATTSQNWTGGAQVANAYGTAGMSLASWNTTLVGRKSWFMLDNEIICLGAGITCAGPAEVHTTVEDRRLGTSPTNNFWVNGVKFPPKIGWSSNQMNASWCAVDGVGGYYFPGGGTNLQAAFVANTGSWSQINSGGPTTPTTDDYLTLWFNHGLKPTNATYAYVILPNLSAVGVSNYARAPDFTVLTNTAAVQAVKKAALGVVAANFWTNGNYSADLISINSKASVITLENSNSLVVGLSDPTQTNTGIITLTLNRAAAAIHSIDPGVTVLRLTPQIILSVNVNGSLGKTFQASFIYSNSIFPVVGHVFPDGAALFQSTNTLAFNVTGSTGIPASGVVMELNNLLITNLTFTGSSTNWNVSYPHLEPNTLYSAIITVTDANGNVVTTTNTFDTFSGANFTVEAEDFDYGGGDFINPPETNAYAGLAATVNVDTYQENFGGTDLYRPNGMDTEVNGDVPRAPYIGTGKTDYSLAYFSPKSWANYTRRYPAGEYCIYARLASGGGATTCGLSRVTGGRGSTFLTTSPLGLFSVANTAWENYNYVPLTDTSGNLVPVAFNGSTNTLQLLRPSTASSDCNANFLMLVPVFLVQASAQGTNLVLSFPTQSGFNYQVQYAETLSPAGWISSGSSISGNNAIQSINGPLLSQPCFYRVLVQ